MVETVIDICTPNMSEGQRLKFFRYINGCSKSGVPSRKAIEKWNERASNPNNLVWTKAVRVGS